MTKHNVVFDASALLAWVKAEEGHEKVSRYLYDTEISRWLYGVNRAELEYRLLSLSGNYNAVEKILERLSSIGVEFDFTLSEEITKLAATYRERIKSSGLSISMADCFGMAATHLKKKKGRVKFLTTDAGEFKPAKKAGLLPVEVDIISRLPENPPPAEPRPKRKGRGK